jgi:predicted adenine nucleotide alpha hydrolase (AANH) superfamily ATPase
VKLLPLAQEQITEVQEITLTTGRKPSLLLHSCCAPCSSAVLEVLAPLFEISLYYYNPNIHPESEYRRRLDELRTFAGQFPPATNIALIEENYNPEDFYTQTRVREQPALQMDAERGERCFRCYRSRLQKAFDYAVKNKFDFVTTTLSLSPHKDSEKINAIGRELEATARSNICKPPAFLYADFKKKDGYKRSLVLSAQYNLYRQDYCGCEFSLIASQNRKRLAANAKPYRS